ncbi:MAG: insulinase family protein [bacterium]|nr:insulinase family protein [bacterium]
MPRRLLLALLSCALLVPTLCPAADLAAPVPLDPAVTTGTLPNGLRYFVRQNAKPEQRAALWLVVGAGSVDEDDDQQGLAHLIEHMAFNGTENFPKQALVSYLESIGMQFGPEVNAYTSQNETVYMLQVPTDQPGLLDTGLRILEDWAHRVSFDEAEVDKERGVVIEEWRLGRGADERMGDAQLPVIFHGSRYGQRNTIGDPEILRNAPYETLRRFYRDWYRPDLMAVVAVGDFDPAVVEKAIRERFATMPSPEQRRPVLQPEVPDHEKTLFAITTDPEASSSGVSLLIKHEPWGESTVGDFRDGLRGGLANAMLRARLAEISRQADPPFSGAFAMDRRMARTKGAFTLRATVKEDGVARGFEALLTELERATRHGFAPGELERAKIEVLRQAEQAAAEMDKTESQRLARSLQGYFLRGTPYTDAAQRLQLVRDLLPGVTLPEVEARLRELTEKGSRVVTVEAPQRDGLAIPDEAALTAIMTSVAARDIPAYVDATVEAPLVPAVPAPAAITAREHDELLGTTTWTLANGARVVLKPTDFKNDEILMWATSPGGTSLVLDDNLHPRVTAASNIVGSSGAGAFDPTALQKKLAGKLVRVSPYISTYEEGLRGSASPQDFETLMQMTWLLATSPREDATAFKSLLERQRSFLQNRAADPEAAFRDTISVVVTGHHPRRQPPRVEDLDRLDLAASLAFYRERFADFSDFTFFLVGAIDPATAEPLVRTWLGNLPGTARRESWRDEGIKLPTGVQERVLHRGTEPKAMVEMVFTARHEWSWPAEYALDSLTDVLRIRLRESIREDKSGTYGVRVGGGLNSIPYGYHQLSIGWGCDPARVTELTEAVWAQLNDIAANGPDAETLAKVTATQRRDDELNLKRNDYWLAALVQHHRQGSDPHLMLQTNAMVDGLTADVIKAAARSVIDPQNVVKVVLLPLEN